MHLIRKSLLLVQLPLILNTSYSVTMAMNIRPFAPPRLHNEHEPAKMTPFGHEPAKMVPYTSTSHSQASVTTSAFDESSASASAGGGGGFDSDAGSLDLGPGAGDSSLIPGFEYNPCPQEEEFYRQNSYTMFRRHAYNCARFYMCNFGLPIEFSCPTGQLWDQSITSCNFASAVDCTSKRSVPNLI